MLNINAFGRIATSIPLEQSKDKKHLYTNFLLASHNNKETTFIRCVAFDAMATLIHDYFSCGDRISIKGELISDDYKKKKSFKIRVENFDFIETKEDHEKNKQKHSSEC